MTQQLVLQFAVGSMEDYDAVVALEDRLIDGLADGSVVDGHDVGGGAMHVYIWTDDADVTFSRAHELVRADPLAEHLRAGYRDRDGDEFTPLWPADLTEFDIVW
jgi:hypothetical protein